MGQRTQEWTKQNLWKTAFKNFEVIQSVFYKFYLVHSWSILEFHFAPYILISKINNLLVKIPFILLHDNNPTWLYQPFYILRYTEIQCIITYVILGKPNTSFLIFSRIVRLCKVSNDNLYSFSLECLLFEIFEGRPFNHLTVSTLRIKATRFFCLLRDLKITDLRG